MQETQSKSNINISNSANPNTPDAYLYTINFWFQAKITQTMLNLSHKPIIKAKSRLINNKIQLETRFTDSLISRQFIINFKENIYH